MFFQVADERLLVDSTGILLFECRFVSTVFTLEWFVEPTRQMFRERNSLDHVLVMQGLQLCCYYPLSRVSLVHSGG